MSVRKFAGIDELINDIKDNYYGAEIGNIYDGKYRVTSVKEGAVEGIVEQLKCWTERKKTQLIYLILEETDG